MAPIILFLFIAVPILEIAVLIQVGSIIGTWPTVGLVILTAVVGTALLRAQGMATLARAQEALNRGEAPLREVFDGACLLVAGVLLLTPGFVTDSLGLSLFLSPVRSALLLWAAKAAKSGKVQFQFGRAGHQDSPFGHDPFGRPAGGGPGGASDIEGEYRDVTPGAGEDGPDSDRASDEPRRLDRK